MGATVTTPNTGKKTQTKLLFPRRVPRFLFVRWPPLLSAIGKATIVVAASTSSCDYTADSSTTITSRLSQVRISHGHTRSSGSTGRQSISSRKRRSSNGLLLCLFSAHLLGLLPHVSPFGLWVNQSWTLICLFASREARRNQSMVCLVRSTWRWWTSDASAALNLSLC